MKCVTCNTELNSPSKTGATCLKCGTINTSKSKVFYQKYWRQITISIASLLIILIGIGAVATYQNNRAQTYLADSQIQTEKGEYEKADETLAKAKGIFLLSSTKQRIDQAINQNRLWRDDAERLAQALKLSYQSKFTEAERLINQISKNFPSYHKVIDLRKSIVEQKAAIAKKEQERSAGSNNKPVITTKPTNYDTANGKRFVSTAAAAQLASATSVDEAQQALQQFASQYDLTFQVTSIKPSSYSSTYNTFDTLSGSDLSSLKSYGAIFIDEWAKYPKDWVASSGLKYVYFVKNFVSSGDRRAAGPDPFGEAMYYDVGYGSADYARGVIHHEYAHLFTYNYFNSYAPSDPTWQSYNPSGFKYGNGGASCYQANNTCLTGQHPVAGFVTGYATSAIEEDKAELYAYLMTRNYYKSLQNWIPADNNLAKKVDNYKQFISSHSSNMSGGYFNDINP